MNHPSRRSLTGCLLLAFLCTPAVARAQWVETSVGTVLGAGGGALVSAAWVTVDAHRGNYLFDIEDATWQLLPIPLGAAFGGTLGYRNSGRLWDGVAAGTAGLAVGAGVGALVGRIAWDTPEGTWAGAVIGGAAGLVIGTAVGTLRWERDEDRVPLVNVSIPIG